MNKTLNFLTIFMVVILASFFVSGAPPTFATSKGALSVVSVHPPVMKYNNSNELYFHVYNSNNTWLNTSQFNCTFHLYNQSNGQHLFEGVLSTHSTTEAEYVLNYSLIQQKGTYDYIVYCSGILPQAEKGFLSNYFTLTTTGELLTYEAFVIPIVLMILPILFVFLLLYWVLQLGEEHTELKIGMTLFSSTMPFLSLLIALETIIKFFEWDSMQDILTTGLWIYGILFFMLLFYWFVYLMKTGFDSAKEEKMKRLNY